MRIAVLGVGHIGSTVGRLWYAAGHEVTFAGRDEGESRELAAELGDRAHAAPVADAVTGADVVLVAVPGAAVTDVLAASGGC
jgi:8-hydroxy-5-deazaflavin:NADPH oxidoreductase